MNQVLSRSTTLPLRQRGMATLLILIVAGMGLSVTAMGVMYSVRTSQEQQVTVHAATHAQAGVWAAEKVVRLYLEKLDKAELTALDTSKPLEFRIGDNQVTAQLTPFILTPGGLNHAGHIHSEISYTDVAAKASSTLEVVYNVTPASVHNKTPYKDKPSITLNGPLTNTGNSNLIGNKHANINVIGVVTLNGGKIYNFDTFNATDHITISANDVEINELYGNGNITISGHNAKIGSINAVGNITISGKNIRSDNINSGGNITVSGASAQIKNISAKEYITLSSDSAEVLSANTEGHITISGANANVSHVTVGDYITLSSIGAKIASANAGRHIVISGANTEVTTANAGSYMTISGAGVNITHANAVGAITIAGDVTVSHSTSEAEIKCPSAAWSQYESVTAGTATTTCPSESVSIDPTVSVSALIEKPTLIEVPKRILTIAKVDAYALQSSANYIFTHDGHMRVKVKDINGIPKGDYYVSSSGGLCVEENCTTALFNICKPETACTIEYASSVWTIEGDTQKTVLTPSVLWFQGSLILQQGIYHNSIIASESITTSTNVEIYAVNYGGYESTCTNTVLYDPHYPTNFCPKKDIFKSNAIGNIALLAGGYGSAGSFSGGYINLEGDPKVHGSIIAGNTLDIKGHTEVYGYVTAAGQGTVVANTWGDDIKIDVSNLPEYYKPAEIQDMNGNTSVDDDSGSGGDSGAKITPTKAEILWSRYL